MAGPGCDANEMAAAVASAATSGEGASAMKEIATLAQRLHHQEFQGAVAQAVFDGLRVMEERACNCIQFIVRALRAPHAGPDLANDAVWMLNRLLCHTGDSTKRWVLEAGGLPAIHHVLDLFPLHRDLVQRAAWVVYTLAGVPGLAVLLGDGADEAARARVPDGIVADVVWVLYELRKEDPNRHTNYPEEAVQLVRLIAWHWARRCHDLDVHKACCVALDLIGYEAPELGALFVELGVAPLMVEAMRMATDQGETNVLVVSACKRTLEALSKSGPAQVYAICQQGTPEALIRLGLRGSGGEAEEAAVVALGRLKGLGAVLEAMQRGPQLPTVMLGGLASIAELAVDVREPYEVQRLPALLGGLLKLHADLGGPASAVDCHQKCIAAISSTTCALAQYAGPGQVPDLDRALVMYVSNLNTDPIADFEVATMVVEALGRIALTGPGWREEMVRIGAFEVVRLKIGAVSEDKRLLRYCFWLAAALSGLSFVIQELQVKLEDVKVIDAAFTTLIDILDDDVEGDWVLKDAEKLSKPSIPTALTLIAEAMRAHASSASLQSHGLYCVALLARLVPPEAIPKEAMVAVFEAVRWHSQDPQVVRDACSVFQAVLWSSMDAADTGQQRPEAHHALVVALCQEGVDSIAERALYDFGDGHERDLIEEAVLVLSALVGIPQALSALIRAGPGPVRTYGVKAIFEFARRQPSCLLSCATDVANSVAAMVQESPSEELLQQHAALLVGVLRSAATQAMP